MCCERVASAGQAQRSSETALPPSRSCWRACGVRSVCLLGGAIGGAAAGAAAAVGYIAHLVLSDAHVYCEPGAQERCTALPMTMGILAPFAVLVSAVGLAPFGALAGNRIANRILNRHL